MQLTLSKDVNSERLELVDEDVEAKTGLPLFLLESSNSG